jgi:hypothetical protein
MALPVLEGIASVFGAAVPAYQQARNFVLKSQEAALDYRIAVANLITRLRTEELANAARMRSAAADAISNVRRTFELEGPVYQAVVAELINSNVPDQQQKNFLDSVRNQGYLTEDDVGYVFDLTKGDGLGGAGGGAGGRGQDDYALTEDYFKTEISNINSRIGTNLRELANLEDQHGDDSTFQNMSPSQQRRLISDIMDLKEQNNALIRDQNQLYASRDFVERNRNRGITVTLDEVIEQFPLRRHRANRPSTGTPVVTPPVPIDENPDFELEWDGSSTPNPNFLDEDLERARRDSALVDDAIPIVAPVYKDKQ